MFENKIEIKKIVILILNLEFNLSITVSLRNKVMLSKLILNLEF